MLHTAIFTGIAAGQIARSLDHAERHCSLPFLREERYLGSEDLIAPAALTGQWDRVALGGQWRRGWEHAGRPVAVGRSMTPAAVAMVHGLRGDDAARAGWPSSPPSAVSPSTTRCAAPAEARCSRPSCCSTAARRTRPWTC